MKFSELPKELTDIIREVCRNTVKAAQDGNVIFEQKDYETIFWLLFNSERDKTRYTANTSKKAAVALLHDLNTYIINTSRAQHTYQLKLRNPISVRRPKPPLRQHNLSLLPLLEQLDQNILGLGSSGDASSPERTYSDIETILDLKLHKLKELSLKAYLGRLIYAAMRFGGLLRNDLIKSLFHALLFDQPFCHQNIFWFELKGKANETQLWLPDPISLLLINRFYQQKDETTGLFEGPDLPFTEQQCLHSFLVKNAAPQIAQMPNKDLKDLIIARLSLSMTPCLLPVLTDQESNLTLAPASFYRLLGFKPRGQEEILVEQNRQPKNKFTPILEAERSKSKITDCIATIRTAKAILKKAGDDFTHTDVQNRKRPVGNKISGYSLKDTSLALLGLANEPNKNLLPITRELLRWCAHRLVSQSQWSQKLRPQSLLTFLGSVFLPLTRFFAEHRLENLAPSTIDEIYLEIIDDAQGLAAQTKRAKFLRDFDIFLVKEYGFTPSYVFTQTIVKGAREQAIMVDANILLPLEYTQAFEFFSGQDNYQAQLVLLILGFRCGLRRSEAYMLRLCDIHTQDCNETSAPHFRKPLVSAATELLIRPHQQRGLKSAAALRRVPIGLLATPQELKVLEAYLAPRVNRLETDDYLFVDPKDLQTLLDDGALFDPLVSVLQLITGDDAFRFHRLRHSFVTWLFWYWQQDKYLHLYPLKTQLQHPAMSHLTDARMQYFDTDKAAPTRKILHAISLMTGHSGPSITTLHYLHSMHWAAVAEFWRDSHFSRELEIELLGIHRRSVFRGLQNGTISDLIAPQFAQYCKRLNLDEGTCSTELPSPDTLHQHIYGKSEKRLYQVLFDYQNASEKPELNLMAARYQVDAEQLNAAVEALQQVESLKIVRIRTEQPKNKDKEQKAELGSPDQSLSDTHQVDLVQSNQTVETQPELESLKLVQECQDEDKTNDATTDQDHEMPGSSVSDAADNSQAQRIRAKLNPWPRHTSAEKTVLRIFKIFQQLSADEQNKVLKASTELVWKFRSGISDIRFHNPKRFWAFIDNIEPLSRHLLPTQKLKLMIRQKSPLDSEERENFLLKWSLTGEKREQFVILHSEYEFLGPRRYVSLNLSLPLDNARAGSSSDKGDYGFKFALIALYYLQCRDNPHIQSFIDGKGKEYVPKRSKPQRKTPRSDWDEDPFLSMVFGEPETLDEQLYPAVPPNYDFDALYFDNLLPLPPVGPNYDESYFDNLPPVPPDEPDSEI